MYKLIVLTGASGAGKTTIVNHIRSTVHEQPISFLHFDSIGVPTVSEMQIKFGSPENWQKAKTFEWMTRIKKEYLGHTHVLFEGQSRIEFLKLATVEADINDPKIILIDCNDVDRYKRLSVDRNQPDLANQQMMDWAKYQREEASRKNCHILNTSLNSLSECVEFVRSLIK